MVETLRDENDAALDRRRLILEGAGKAFLRYGFERASMADIAVAAGVSRTALYCYFPGKDEVLQAVVDELNARSLQAAAEVLEKSQTLDAALTGLFEAKFGRTLVLFAESPHGVELVDAGHRVTGPATRAADKAFHALVVKAPYAPWASRGCGRRRGHAHRGRQGSDAIRRGLRPKGKVQSANPPTGRLADKLTT